MSKERTLQEAWLAHLDNGGRARMSEVPVISHDDGTYSATTFDDQTDLRTSRSGIKGRFLHALEGLDGTKETTPDPEAIQRALRRQIERDRWLRQDMGLGS